MPFKNAFLPATQIGGYPAPYDEYGNAPILLSTVDKRRLDNNDWIRASGLCLCEKCGLDYYSHPRVIGALWLRRRCDGKWLKL